jgi:hypothetical protein
VVSLLASVVADLDPDRLSGPDATTLYRALAEVERLVVAGKALVSPRIEASGVWKAGGHRDAAALLAELEGISPGQARRTLEVGQRLTALPGTEAAARTGSLSGPKLTALTEAALADPTKEGELLQGADSEPLALVTERCRRARATAASADPTATLRAIHARRHFRSWTDPEGAFCYEGRDTADRGAQLMSVLTQAATALRRARRRAGEPAEPEGAFRADALYALLTRPAGSPAPGDDPGDDPDGEPAPRPRPGPDRAPLPPELQAVVDRPPRCTVIVRVDRDALVRGTLEPGERCELDGAGPIPVAMARSLASDAFLALLFHQAGDIQAVSHLGRTIKRTLRTALVSRDRRCVVPGCGATTGLEIDHILPFGEDGPTELNNLALLCHHHHHLKTYGGWTLTRTGTGKGATPTWSFTPEPPVDPGPDRPERQRGRHHQRE